MFKSFFNVTLLSFILVIIIAIIITFFSTNTITPSEEYYSKYNINFSSITSNFTRFLLALAY